MRQAADPRRTNPVKPVFYGPVPPDRIGQLGSGGVVVGQVGDRVHGLAADPFARKRPAGADDLNRQRGMREGDTGGDLHQLHGPGLDSAMTLVAGGVSGWDLFPGHGPELAVQAGLVALDDQDVVSAPTEQVLGVGPLGVQASAVMIASVMSKRSNNGPKALIS